VLSFSWELGIKKPSREIFDETLNKMGLKPEEVIFVDDGALNIQKAKEYGLNGIQFKSVDQLKEDLGFYNIEI